MSEKKLRILFVADGRSPIALNWIAYFGSREHCVDQDYEVHLVSTFACNPEVRLASLHVVPVAFSGFADQGKAAGANQNRSGLRSIIPVGLRTAIRRWIAPFTLSQAAEELRGIVKSIEPDLVHAMRIPFEGMLAAAAQPDAPLLVSIWGNDFTLHAPATAWMGKQTRATLDRASAVHADCHRDVRLAQIWGFPPNRPSIVLPGAGGIQMDIFFPTSNLAGDSPPVVINPRGIRAYVRNDTFFQAIPIVLAQHPGVRFICPTMAGEAQAQEWVDKLGIAGSVGLLPRQSRQQMAELFRRAQIVVSPSVHDGTPNTLLEAMACGCLPIAGDIESLREWITPGVNGLLVDPADPGALAEAILLALKQPKLRQQAASFNRQLVEERAEYQRVMQTAVTFYTSLCKNNGR